MATPEDHTPSYLDIRWDAERWMLLRLTNFGTQLSFSVGDAIVEEGEPGDGLYLILSGSAKVVRDAATAQAKTLNTLGAFRSFGEMSILLDRPRTATVVATSPLRCVKLTRRQLIDLESKEPKLAVRLYQLVAQSLARSLLSTPA